MPNNAEMGTFDNRKASEPWKPPTWLEPAFIYIAFTVAVVASVALLLWILVTFVVPFNLYSKETEEITLTNGQTLQVKYPNLVLAGDMPANITLILVGESNAADPATFDVVVPPGLTVVEPAGQAQSKNVELTAPDLGSATTPTQMAIGVVNSQSVNGALLFKRHPVEINSNSMSFSRRIGVGVENIFWTSMRGIVNNTINERSTLILLVTGFLSGAGTLVLQYMKTHRDRIREDQQRKEKNFRDDLDKEPLEILNRFVSLAKGPLDDGSDFFIYRALVEGYGWEYRLQQIVLEKLKAKDYFEAKRAGDILGELFGVFIPENEARQTNHFEFSKPLVRFSGLACLDDPKNHTLTLAEAQCLRTILRRWQELRPIVINLIHDFTNLAVNLPLIYDCLASEQQGQLLREANIYKIIEVHINKLKDDNKEESQAFLTAAEKISDLLIQEVQWREIRSRKERVPSDKVLRWLSGHFFESVDPNFSLGSEYAELDSEQRKPEVEHPVFKEINQPSATIVFGAEGMGKTVTALWLADQHRRSTTTGVFPVYAPYESGVDLTNWILAKIAGALIDFTADNPRKFIAASDARKTAMGRLMFWHTQSLETLRLNLYSSPFVVSSKDIGQVLEHVRKFAPKKSSTKSSRDGMLSSLSLARPDIFDQIYFLWDIRSSSSREEVVGKITEMAGLADLLARQSIYIKIFAPLTAKQKLGDLRVIRLANHDLTWSEPMLKELLEKKIPQFPALWDKSMENSVEMVISVAERSPRRLMQLLLRLSDYVDEHVQEDEKLNKSDFEKVRLALAEKK